MEGVVSSVNCWHCKTELIWGGDHDIDDEFYVMVTNLSCPNCESIVDVYYPKEKEDGFIRSYF
jgi:hypothetical protein